ncbi:MAG TPA: hypothetical protein VM509_11945 [Planctomycetota bacterium]|nr:hypothetical protein [Planctomycetota bacterium]
MSKRILLPLCLLLVAACSKESNSATSPAASAAIPASMKLEAAPPAAISVIDLRKSAADGAEVVVTGRVKYFGEKRAIFTIADMSLKSCSDAGDAMVDSCKTPWDYCCVDSKVLAEGTTAIEVRADGQPAQGTVKGWNGLDYLKQVTVHGKVHRAADGDLAVIADGIFVQS